MVSMSRGCACRSGPIELDCRHRTDVRAYRTGGALITWASYLTFVEGGGYQRREWWSAEGWAWKEPYDITKASTLHASWFEADAFARADGAGLPTDTGWEKAATWDQEPNGRAGPAIDVPGRRAGR
jgi:gamma-glutamyl hercynylcysteine S-oxide synthase